MSENKVYTAIGLMSGTSLDGVDAALLETDGRGYVKPLGFVTMPYAQRVRDEIRAVFGVKNRRDPKLLEAEKLVTFKHIEAIEELMRQTGHAAKDIDVIGFHGQTVYHAPADRITIQIGDGDLMARECRIDVVDDFRIEDVKAGGEGAPLAPVYHAARMADAKVDLPVAVLNIGGVANVTWIGEGEGNIIAFDTGPGNALMDDWIKSRTGKPYDEDGRYAAHGTPIEQMLREWSAHPYFTRKPPKSLDRDQWDIAALGQVTQNMENISTEDGAATLLRFSGDMIARSVEHMPQAPKAWYACGGGRHNKALMKYLNEKLDGTVKTVDDLGWNGDATEAECFGYLAVRKLLDLPISFPGTTGVMQPMTGGKIHKA
jgi:anhydro-N-acetylmuramic acid kinase